MSQKNRLESIDLSLLPEPLRHKVQEQLNRMTPEMQQEFLKKSRPMLNRAMDAAKTFAHDNDPEHKLTARPKPRGHYNGTIQPGDSGGFGFLRWLVFILLFMGVYKIFN